MTEYVSVIRSVASVFLPVDAVPSGMPSVELEEETVQRLDDLRIEDESYDELITELMNIYETSELTLFHSGD
ncbi:hypothetical protein EL22_26345 [Halostagnicola sp. A56]|nr:hypothetical protein EL22_26345 [Halostagnicola sp. A56]